MNLIILSRNKNTYSTRRLEREATNRNHHVQVVDHSRCNVILEQGNPSIQYGGRPLQNVQAVIPRIGSSVTFFGTAVVRQFEMMHVFSANESQAIVRARDKLRSLQLLSRAGLGIPKTVFADNTTRITQMIEMAGGLPVIIKLLEGTQGLGVILAETPSSARSTIEAFLGRNLYALIQEYIPESNGEDVRVLIVNGKVAGAMLRKSRSNDFRSNLHRGGSGKPTQLSSAEEELAIHAAETLGLKIAGVDLLRSNRGPLVLEVNSSPGLRGIESVTGKNIAAEIIQFVEEHAPVSGVKDKIGF